MSNVRSATVANFYGFLKNYPSILSKIVIAQQLEKNIVIIVIKKVIQYCCTGFYVPFIPTSCYVKKKSKGS